MQDTAIHHIPQLPLKQEVEKSFWLSEQDRTTAYPEMTWLSHKFSMDGDPAAREPAWQDWQWLRVGALSHH